MALNQKYDNADYFMATLDPPVKIKGGEVVVESIEYVPFKELTLLDARNLRRKLSNIENDEIGSLMEVINFTGSVVEVKTGRKIPIPKNFWDSVKVKQVEQMSTEMVDVDPNE